MPTVGHQTSIASCMRVLLVGALVFNWPANAAWDSTYRDNDPGSATIRPILIATPDPSGYWVGGTVGTGGSRDPQALARYSSDGVPVVLRQRVVSSLIDALPDGDVLSAGSEFVNSPLGCFVERRDVAGNRRWRTAIGARTTCRALEHDGAGGAWVTTEPTFVVVGQSAARTLRRLGIDGVVGARGDALIAAVGNSARLVGDPGGPGVYGVGSALTGAGATTAAIVALDGSGSVRWSHQLPPTGDTAAEYLDVAIDDEGSIYAVGLAQTASPVLRLLVVSYERDGRLRFTRAYEIESLRGFMAMVSADSGLHLLASTAQAGAADSVQLLRIGGDGTQIRSLRFAGYTAPVEGQACPFGRSRDGTSVALAGLLLGASAPVGQVARVGADGTIRTTTIGAVRATSLAMLDDGSTLLATQSTTASGAPLLLVGPDGALKTAPPTAAGAQPPVFAGNATTADGNVYLVSRDPAHARITTERIAPTGTRVWRVNRDAGPHPQPGWPPYLRDRVLADATADRVCYGAQRYLASTPTLELIVTCLDADAGALIFERSFPYAGDDETHDAFRVLPNGNVRVLSAGHFLGLAANGDTQFDTAVPYLFGAAAIGPTGTASVVGSNRVVALTADGMVRYDIAQFIWNPEAAAGADGSTVVLDRGGASVGSEQRVTLIGPDGVVRWSRSLGNVVVDYGQVEFVGNATAYVIAEPSLYDPDDPPYEGAPLKVGMLALADGSTRWQQTLRRALYQVPALALDPQTGTLVTAIGSPHARIRIVALDPDTGAITLDRSESCINANCTVATAAIDSVGTLRVVAAASDPATDIESDVRLFALQAPLAALPPIRVDQRGIAGAWYPDYAPGEGLVIDYLESSRTLFAPWFTFSQAGGNDPSGQRWYSLQGTVPVGAVSATLDIYENLRGRFAAPPATVPRRVGVATLRFNTCTRASLDYAFDPGENDAANGRYTLTRLTPALAACGTSTSAASVQPMSTLTFETRQSGSWLDPATSGQGLTLTMVPGSVLFGAWFTYDFVGAQRWLTLQGDLGSSSSTTALVIYQTLGGTFDGLPAGRSYRVGEATLTLQACDRATLDYRFDGGEVAGPYAGRSGTIALEKIGGCPPTP